MRNTGGISESELGTPALKAMKSKPGGFIPTSDLIGELWNVLQPTGHDAQVIQGRNDTYFSQKVRNIISHRDQPGNIIHDGYAEYIDADEGLKITDAGLAHLAVLGL